MWFRYIVKLKEIEGMKMAAQMCYGRQGEAKREAISVV